MVVLINVGLLLFSSNSDVNPYYFSLFNAELNFNYNKSKKMPLFPKEMGKSHSKESPLLEITWLNMEPLVIAFSSF